MTLFHTMKPIEMFCSTCSNLLTQDDADQLECITCYATLLYLVMIFKKNGLV